MENTESLKHCRKIGVTKNKFLDIMLGKRARFQNYRKYVTVTVSFNLRGKLG